MPIVSLKVVAVPPKVAIVAHRVAHHAHNIQKNYRHEVAVATIPLIVDFHLIVFGTSVAALFALYIIEEYLKARGGG